MALNTVQTVKRLFEFGPFRVDPEKELLLRGAETVPLTPKTFQILLVLIRHSKEVVTKDDLLKAVWPDTFVEEATSAEISSCCAKPWVRVRKTTNTSSPFRDVVIGSQRT